MNAFEDEKRAYRELLARRGEIERRPRTLSRVEEMIFYVKLALLVMVAAVIVILAIGIWIAVV